MSSHLCWYPEVFDLLVVRAVLDFPSCFLQVHYGKSVVIRSTSMPISTSLLPRVVSGWHAQVSPPITVVPPTAPNGCGPFLVLMPYRFSGVPLVKRQWEFPESQNTFTLLFFPGMLQNKKSGGSFSLVMRVSPAGVQFFSLDIICAGRSPVNGISSLSLLLDEALITLGL